MSTSDDLFESNESPLSKPLTKEDRAKLHKLLKDMCEDKERTNDFNGYTSAIREEEGTNFVTNCTPDKKEPYTKIACNVGVPIYFTTGATDIFGNPLVNHLIVRIIRTGITDEEMCERREKLIEAFRAFWRKELELDD